MSHEECGIHGEEEEACECQDKKRPEKRRKTRKPESYEPSGNLK